MDYTQNNQAAIRMGDKFHLFIITHRFINTNYVIATPDDVSMWLCKYLYASEYKLLAAVTPEFVTLCKTSDIKFFEG